MPSPDSEGVTSGVSRAGAEAAAEGAEVADRRARTAAGPPARGDRLMAWLYLLFVLVVALVPLSFKLGAPDVVDRNELSSLSATIQTWLTIREHMDWQDLFSPTRVTPVISGELEASHPPGLGVLHIAAFSMLGEEQQDPAHWVTAARRVSVLMALLATAGVFWAGYSIGGARGALLGAVVWIAVPLVLYDGRLATSAMPVAAFITLSIASALWAARPLKPPPSRRRQALGWTVGGLTLGAAILIAGPRVLPAVVLPVFLVLLLCPHRVSHVLGLVAQVFVGALAVLPWIVHLHGEHPDAWRQWAGALVPVAWPDPGAMASHSGRWVVWLLVALLPWSFWLIGAVLQPFSTSSSGSRLRLFVAWVYFIASAAVYAVMPVSDRSGAALPAIAATSVLLGQLFSQYHDLASEGRFASLWRGLRWPQINLLMVCSIVLPLAMYFQGWLVGRGVIDGAMVDAPPWPVLIGMSVVLLLLTALSLRWANANQPVRTVVVWSLWVVVSVVLVVQPAADGPVSRQPLRGDALHAASLVGDRPVYWRTDSEAAVAAPPPAVLIYLGSAYTPLSVERLAAARQRESEVFIFTTGTQPPLPGATQRMDWARAGLHLWYVGPLSPDTGPDAVSDSVGKAGGNRPWRSAASF